MKQCALCGNHAPDDAHFCPLCGVSLGVACPVCAAVNNIHAQRCGSCGAVLGGPVREPAQSAVRAPRESRRIVTVLFADIAGYTSMVEAHAGQTEQLRGLLQECFDELAANILDQGGIVEKFIGDAICALFGAPAVHEDDPERALTCALDMQRTMQRIDERRASADGAHLRLRIGVATGEVVGGTAQQAGQEQYSVTGDAVNTASRLQTAAEPGQILVSASTEQLTRDRFVFEDAGALKLKGKRAPVSTFRLVEPRAQADRPANALVNRRRELEHLGYCMGLASEGAAQLVEIIGDAGVGKSRLVDAFIEQASRVGALVLRGDCPTTMAQPLHPFRSVCTELVTRGNLGDSDLSIRLQDALAAASTGVSSEQSEEVATSLYAAIGERSKHGPVVLILENVHRADQDTLDVLRRLLPRMDDERLVILWTRRSGEELIMQADSLAEYTRMSLRPLHDRDAERLMRQLLADTTIPPQLEATIIDRSGGNPLYIEAMVRTIVDEGPAAAQLSSVEIPTTVQGLIQARLDGLPEPQRLAAQEAAVAGREFDGRLLQEVDLFGIEMEPALEALAQRGMIDRVSGSTYRFRHVLTQEVCYETMLQALRSELHREIADVVADLFPERAVELAPYRADHYAKAGDTDRAVEVLVEAGVAET